MVLAINAVSKSRSSSMMERNDVFLVMTIGPRMTRIARILVLPHPCYRRNPWPKIRSRPALVLEQLVLDAVGERLPTGFDDVFADADGAPFFFAVGGFDE